MRARALIYTQTHTCAWISSWINEELEASNLLVINNESWFNMNLKKAVSHHHRIICVSCKHGIYRRKWDAFTLNHRNNFCRWSVQIWQYREIDNLDAKICVRCYEAIEIIEQTKQHTYLFSTFFRWWTFFSYFFFLWFPSYRFPTVWTTSALNFDLTDRRSVA